MPDGHPKQVNATPDTAMFAKVNGEWTFQGFLRDFPFAGDETPTKRARRFAREVHEDNGPGTAVAFDVRSGMEVML